MKIESYKIYSVMYHYVHDESIDNLKFNKLKINEFKNQISFFNRKYNIIGYQDFLEILKRKKIPKKPSILLTFDDGYKDHIENVFSVLKKNRLKAFFYPPTNIFKKKLLDVNKIQLIISKKPSIKKLLDFTRCQLKGDFNKILLNNKSINQSKYDDKETTLFKRLYQYAIPEKKRLKLLNFLFKKIVNESESLIANKLYLNKKELLILHKDNMHIGIHGTKHYWWSKISYNKQFQEILAAKKYYNKLNISSNSICYPYGSYNDDTIKILKKLKFDFALTTKKGTINQNNISEIYKLRRFDANDFKFVPNENNN